MSPSQGQWVGSARFNPFSEAIRVLQTVASGTSLQYACDPAALYHRKKIFPLVQTSDKMECLLFGEREQLLLQGKTQSVCVGRRREREKSEQISHTLRISTPHRNAAWRVREIRITLRPVANQCSKGEIQMKSG
jgi:hypothetical protein